MKNKFTQIALLLMANAAYGQITINASDMPVPPETVNLSFTNTITTPTKGANQTWNYGTVAPSSLASNVFYAETNPTFTAAGVDVYYDVTQKFNANFYYDASYEYDFNANGVDDKGFYVYKQAYDLASFTGSNLDSLKMDEQSILLQSPRRFVKFPFTMGDTWSSISRRPVNFTLSVAAYGLVNTPAQHVATVHRQDTVVGYGKLRVYTLGGPSAPYDVLMNKVVQYTTDSFYLGGAPAPTALLTAFGVSQNQRLDDNYFYNFYRKGHYNYLMRVNFNDGNFNSINSVYTNIDDIAPLAIAESNKELYSTIVYPNPCTTNDLQVIINGNTFGDVQYYITDVTGKLIAQNKIQSAMQFIKIPIADDWNNGIYTLHISNQSNKEIVNETFTIQR
jgi:Secretion system C-terminal sorting domain